MQDPSKSEGFFTISSRILTGSIISNFLNIYRSADTAKLAMKRDASDN